MKRLTFFNEVLIITVLFAFCVNMFNVPIAAGQGLALPQPGTMVGLSNTYQPILLKGLKINRNNPLSLDFILDTGDSQLDAKDERVKSESQKLIQYFLTSMTVPEKDLWVNLSPYEKNRMIARNFGHTQMGQDMLAQDYMLKQITASLIYPKDGLGKKFWDKVYEKAGQMYGQTQLPINTLNKVWIVADRADVYEGKDTAYVVGAHLKVMLEQDYLAKSMLSAKGGSASGKEEDYVALGKNQENGRTQGSSLQKKSDVSALGSTLMSDLIIPEIEREVNSGSNFAGLRQMFYAMILASWYKMALKDAVLTQVYGNQSKVKVGVNADDQTQAEKIYKQYVLAYKKGVFNFIADESIQGQTVPRKYFSGGADFAVLAKPDGVVRRNQPWKTGAVQGKILSVKADMSMTVETRNVNVLEGELRTDYTNGRTYFRLGVNRIPISRVVNIKELKNGYWREVPINGRYVLGTLNKITPGTYIKVELSPMDVSFMSQEVVDVLDTGDVNFLYDLMFQFRHSEQRDQKIITAIARLNQRLSIRFNKIIRWDNELQRFFINEYQEKEGRPIAEIKGDITHSLETLNRQLRSKIPRRVFDQINNASSLKDLNSINDDLNQTWRRNRMWEQIQYHQARIENYLIELREALATDSAMTSSLAEQWGGNIAGMYQTDFVLKNGLSKNTKDELRVERFVRFNALEAQALEQSYISSIKSLQQFLLKQSIIAMGSVVSFFSNGKRFSVPYDGDLTGIDVYHFNDDSTVLVWIVQEKPRLKPLTGKKILVLDIQDFSSLDEYKQLFEQAGAEVEGLTAFTPDVVILQKLTAKKYDLIITKVDRPIMNKNNGVKLSLSWANTVNGQTPVIYTTVDDPKKVAKTLGMQPNEIVTDKDHPFGASKVILQDPSGHKLFLEWALAMTGAYDYAQMAQKGGIDLDRANMTMNVRREQSIKDAGFHFDQAMIERMRQQGFDGLTVHIKSITAVENPLNLLGVLDPSPVSEHGVKVS